MKILIEESVLRQALDVLVSISREMVLDPLEVRTITALRETLNAAEKVEDQLAAVTKERDAYSDGMTPRDDQEFLSKTDGLDGPVEGLQADQDCGIRYVE